MCELCGGAGVVTAARVESVHGLSYAAWSAAVVIDCPRCAQ